MSGDVVTRSPSLRRQASGRVDVGGDGLAASGSADALMDPLLHAQVGGRAGPASGGVGAKVGLAGAGAKGSAKVGADGVDASVGASASAKVLEAAAAGKVGNKDAHVQAAAKGEVLSAAAQGKAGLKAGADGVEAGASGDAGAYLARGEAEAEGGFRIPFTNIRVGGSASAQGSVGAGAGGSAHFSAGEDGFSIGAKGNASLGVGGGFGLGFSVSKANKDAGWFG
jgi:hypothetical protein